MSISKRKVDHIGPLSSPIFILGEAPSSDDEHYGEPFSSQSQAGKFLDHCLNLADVDKGECRIGNVCNYHPEKNNFKHLLNSDQLKEGHAELSEYLQTHQPRVIIALGNEALRYLTGHANISDWRGSVLASKHGGWIVPTYHPAAAIRDGTFAPQVVFDLTKAKKVHDQGYTPPIHDFIIDPHPDQLDSILAEVRNAPFIAADIETGRSTSYIKCFGFAVSPTRAFTFQNHYDSGIEQGFSAMVSAVIAAAREIVYHNGSYDTSQLRDNHVEFAERLDYDTMLAQRVLEPELPIGLAFCASIYTDEPYYKNDGKETGKRITWERLAPYNCLDCIVTYQTRLAQEQIFSSDPILAHDKDFIFSRIPLMQEFQRNGMLVDESRRSQLKAATESKLEKAEKIIAIAVAGFELPPNYSLNFRSPKQVKELLYDKLGLPPKRNREGQLTTDEDAIVSLIQYVQGQLDDKKTDAGRDPWRLRLYTLKSLLDIRGNEKLISSYFDAQSSNDGRIRSSYYPAGTDTGRWSCGTYVDGTGLNAQTLPRLEIEIDDESSGDRR